MAAVLGAVPPNRGPARSSIPSPSVSTFHRSCDNGRFEDRRRDSLSVLSDNSTEDAKLENAVILGRFRRFHPWVGNNPPACGRGKTAHQSAEATSPREDHARVGPRKEVEAIGAGDCHSSKRDGKRSRRSGGWAASSWRCRWRSRLARSLSFSPPPWGRCGIRAPQ